MEDRTRDPGDSAISSPFIHVEPFLVMRKESFDFRLASFNYSSSSSCLSVTRAEHVRSVRSTPSPFPLPGRLFSPAHEQKGGHSFLPFSFRIRDCVRVCPPFSSQRRKGKDSIDSVEADRYPHRPLLATHTHTHTHVHVCAFVATSRRFLHSTWPRKPSCVPCTRPRGPWHVQPPPGAERCEVIGRRREHMGHEGDHTRC